QQVERTAAQHLCGCAIAFRLQDLALYLRFDRFPSGWLPVERWHAQELRSYQHDEALNRSEDYEGSSITLVVDEIRNRQRCQRRAEAIRASDQPDAKAASIWKPLHRDADARAVDSACAHAANRIDDIDCGQGIDESRAYPANRDEHARKGYD